MSRQMLVREITKTETEFPDLHLRIKKAREDAAMSITACAEAANVSRQYWSKMENNRLDAVSIDLIRQIETTLKVNLI